MKEFNLDNYFTEHNEHTTCNLCKERFREFATYEQLYKHLESEHGDVL